MIKKPRLGESTLNTKHQLLCAWSGIVFLVIFMLGWLVIGGFVPPPSSAASATEIADFYKQNTTLIRFGLLLAMGSCVFFVPWVAVISVQIKRIEGHSPILAYTQMLGGLVAMLIILFPTMIWVTVSFRPERNPEIMLALNDLAWLIFTMAFAPFVTQGLAIGLAILSDKNPQPVFPRWAGYFNIWAALAFIPSGLIVFFKSGPFAWDGVFGFWLPVGNFGVWFIIMLVLLLKAIKQQAAQAPST